MRVKAARWLAIGFALLLLAGCTGKTTHVRGHPVNREGPGEIPMPPWTPPGAPPVVDKWH